MQVSTWRGACSLYVYTTMSMVQIDKKADNARIQHFQLLSFAK